MHDGIEEIQAAIAELRELANGLYPSALSSGGLAGALDDLATRSPIPITLAVTEATLPDRSGDDRLVHRV